ncbi:hypothetical protein C0J52_10369 [Blattella germanica]|nr:hypothetical protein C0J52_10369 [Blattella germanica]
MISLHTECIKLLYLFYFIFLYCIEAETLKKIFCSIIQHSSEIVVLLQTKFDGMWPFKSILFSFVNMKPLICTIISVQAVKVFVKMKVNHVRNWPNDILLQEFEKVQLVLTFIICNDAKIWLP